MNQIGPTRAALSLMALSGEALAKQHISCAWCVGSFPGVQLFHTAGRHGSSATNQLMHRQIIHRASQQHTRSARLQIICSSVAPSGNATNDNNNDDDDMNKKSDDKDEQNESVTDSGEQEGANMPPPFIDMDLLRRRIKEVEVDDKLSEAAQNDDNDTVEVEIEVGHGAASAEDALRMLGAFAKIRELYVIVFTSRDRSGEGVYSLDVNGESIVLAFQERTEAQRYASLLELQQFPTAKVARLKAEELRAFCTREGYRLGFVPAGSVTLQPPNESAIGDNQRWRIGEGQPQNGDNDGSSGLSKDELDLMKRQLENLFGK